MNQKTNQVADHKPNPTNLQGRSRTKEDEFERGFHERTAEPPHQKEISNLY